MRPVIKIPLIAVIAAASTVGELLAAQGIQLGPLDRVEPDLDVAIGQGMSVRVIRRFAVVADETSPSVPQVIADGTVNAVARGVVPLHTRLYIEGYGPAQAEDIGGAIVGDRSDLVFDTVPEALNWGIRPVTVYVQKD